MSQTAERWWVRIAARWLARLEAAAPLIRMAMLTATGISTGLVALAQYGLGQFALPMVTLGVVGSIVGVWLYTEGGVWNQQKRDQRDLGDNFSAPTMLMEKRIQARQLAHLGYALSNGHGPDLDELEQRLEKMTEEEWARLRDGVDVETIEDEHA